MNGRPAGKPWQWHQRPPLAATRASASVALLIRACKHPGKMFEDWPSSSPNCPFPSFSLSPRCPFNTIPDCELSTCEAIYWMKAENKVEVKVHLKCICSSLWMLLTRDRRGIEKSRKPFGQSIFQNGTVWHLCDRDKASLETSYLKVIMKTNNVTEEILKAKHWRMTSDLLWLYLTRVQVFAQHHWLN